MSARHPYRWDCGCSGCAKYERRASEEHGRRDLLTAFDALRVFGPRFTVTDWCSRFFGRGGAAKPRSKKVGKRAFERWKTSLRAQGVSFSVVSNEEHGECFACLVVFSAEQARKVLDLLEATAITRGLTGTG